MASKLYRRLTGTGANRIQKYGNMFVQAILDGDIENLRRLIKGKIKMAVPMIWSAHITEEVYPIHIACSKGSLEVVKLMFRNGATLENKTESGLTPLHFACYYNNTQPEVIGHLLDMGARPSVKDKVQGQTPFHLACLSNNYGAAKRLMAYTKPTVKDNQGQTAKDIAIENDCDQIVALFEEYDEETKRQEELMRLPERLEELEKRTAAMMRNRSLQSLMIHEGAHRNSSGYCSTDALCSHVNVDLISLQADYNQSMADINNQRPLLMNSSVSSLNSTYNRLPHSQPLVAEQQAYRYTYHGGDTGTVVVANKHPRQSFSPVRSTFSECIEEEPQTKDSPLNKVQRTQVQRNYSMLQSMMKPERVITKLFARLHLDLDAKEKISLMSTQEKNDYILSQYILRGTKGLYDDFLQILRDTEQSHLAERLARLADNPMYRPELIEKEKHGGHKESTV